VNHRFRQALPITERNVCIRCGELRRGPVRPRARSDFGCDFSWDLGFVGWINWRNCRSKRLANRCRRFPRGCQTPHGHLAARSDRHSWKKLGRHRRCKGAESNLHCRGAVGAGTSRDNRHGGSARADTRIELLGCLRCRWILSCYLFLRVGLTERKGDCER